MMRERDFPGGLEIRQIPGAGHFVQQEKPDHVNRLLLDWLDRHN
jgi:pimeloyl-ACP methyl ester carboxylesterase